MRSLAEHDIAFRAPSGVVLARVRLTPAKEATCDATAPLAQIEEAEAREHGETPVQLRESERYEYQVVPDNGGDLRLRCSLASRRKSLGERGGPDAGLLETKTFCGTLLMELVEGPVDGDKTAVASALIDVRSLKLDYRTEYRGMLRRVADEIAGLVADARSSTKTGFQSSFEERRDEGWLQLQLELLREILDSSDFAAAMQRILSHPHETLSNVIDSVSTDRPIRWTSSAVRQLVSNNPRRAVPLAHPLRMSGGLSSVAERISLPRRSRDLDTSENRFIKFALGEFRSFLAHAQGVFDGAKGWGASAALARRLASTVDDWLGRAFFREVGPMRLAPLGSPVLQRKAGYREVLRWWLRFKTAAELSWEGGEDLFKAGQRDVASLYEYWLFFELMNWFYKACRAGNRPAVEELIEGLDEGAPNLRLKKRVELGPFEGAISQRQRMLNARFSYNKRFGAVKERELRGSWTRALHPDYTLSFWPDGIGEAEAEREELLVHIHFDAKYRVENIEGLFGAEDGDDVDEEVDGNYKRQDLLKMHAYRDAIKRSQGAYILYPGRSAKPVRFSGFHEILPGLGAFGVSPDETGKAQGMEELTRFLDEAIAHLCDRATARERGGYHLAKSYKDDARVGEAPLLRLPERDSMGESSIALPPAEHLVLVAMRCDSSQLAWTLGTCLAVVRLGEIGGDWRMRPEWSGLRHIVLRANGAPDARGLWRIAKPGYRIMSGADLAAIGCPATFTADLHAVFDVDPMLDFPSEVWSLKVLLRAIRACETSRRRMLSDPLGRKSQFPRLASLAGLSRK
jgi:predicted component of viral defense system (DUF524 family)